MCNAQTGSIRFVASWHFVLSIAMAGCTAAPTDLGRRAAALTFANDQPAFDYFLGRGLSAVQAAGVVGNLDQESGVDPTSVQSGGPGRGIAQWSVGGRWDHESGDNATAYAAQKGEPLLSLALQLDFVWYELTTFPSYGLSALQNATTISEATVAFQDDFEGCGICDQSQRIAYAQNVFAAFGSDVVDGIDGGAPPDGATAVPCTDPATLEQGACVDVGVCASLGGTSTPGLCPGDVTIECCTHTSQPISDAGIAGSDAKLTGGDAMITGGDALIANGDAGTDGRPRGCSATTLVARPLGAGGWIVVLSLLALARRRRAL